MNSTLRARQAVRPWVENSSGPLLVGVSGGADSLALAIVLLLEAMDRVVIPVVIDHGLQESSAEVAEITQRHLENFGFQKIEKIRINVEITDGLEASARRARYEAFDQVAQRHGSSFFFLGHTENDLAESVLLGLARGSGTRSLSGMAEVNGIYIRPFLQLTRDVTEEVCRENKIEPWRDPHNFDEHFARVRVRRNILPLLEQEIGPGISSALARSSRILREDADALDELAQDFLDLRDSCSISELASLPRAVRARVLRRLIYAAGAPQGSLTYDHIAPIEALVTAWRGQGASSLPGGVKVERISGRLSLSKQVQ